MAIVRSTRPLEPPVALALLVFAGWCWVFWPESIDDAYITLRFARHLAAGDGLVFNVGERVEGYSNLLWVLLLAGATRIGVALPLAMKVLGATSGAAVIALLARLDRAGSRWPMRWAPLAFAASPLAGLWAVDGLETMAYAVLLTGTALAWAARRSGSAGLCAAGAALMRPEGPLFAAIVSAALLRDAWHERRLRPLGAALVPVAAVAAHFAWRAAYYGAWWPNTAGKLDPGMAALGRGLSYLGGFAAASGFVPLGLAALALAARPRSRLAAIGAAFVAAQCGFVLLSGGDFMWGWRFVMPVWPLLAMLVPVGVGVLAASLRPLGASAAGGLAVAVLATSQLAALPRLAPVLATSRAPRDVHYQIAAHLRERTGRADTVLLSEAGIIPFQLEARVVDYLGLVTPKRAVNGAAGGQLDWDYLFASVPLYVVTTVVTERDGSERPRLQNDVRLREAPQFRCCYELEASFPIPIDGGFLDQLYYRWAEDAAAIRFELWRRRGPAPAGP